MYCETRMWGIVYSPFTFYIPYHIYILVYICLGLKEYYDTYLLSSEKHAENILNYGPKIPFGYPNPLPEQLERIKFIVEYAEGNILDIGCDSGFILSECVGNIGIDISMARLKATRHWLPYLTLIQALAEFLPFQQVFDTVIASELLEHVLSPQAVLNEVYRVLKPNGKLVVTVPDEFLGKSHMNPEHLRKFTAKRLRKLLTEHFTIEQFKYIKGDYPVWCVCCKKVNSV